MQFVLKTALLIITIIVATSCSRLQFPWVYRIYIQQGNFVEKDMTEQLEVGMTPEQVRYVMGSPLVADTFHPDRWDYYFALKRGEKQLQEYHLSIFFEDGKLARWEGDIDKESSSKVDPDQEGTNDKPKEGAPVPVEVTPAT
ncbi:outer membrane protein assembly factor BamE [Teredinibacter haidensis]|mgnify:CR=1 FL=1|uniref:outer membrane protein assembly factor BamE n=1 Tax=Teredinibacter haidensis TaxID=2731755 RepID=UPI0009489BC1|nr:outer membrane protein assembly factor BamE [Teredinibacter haidensis]